MTYSNSLKDVFAVLSEHEKTLIAEDDRRWTIAPKCHFRAMFRDEDDSEAWWECSICGHAKSIYPVQAQ